MNVQDKTSLLVSKALDIIFIKYPARTSLGVVIGIAAKFLIDLSSAFIVVPQEILDSSIFGWACLGLLTLHVQTIKSLAKNAPLGDETLETALKLIEMGNFSEEERRQHYRNLVERVSKAVALNAQTKAEVNSIEHGTKSEEVKRE
jgi:hypothetical protein